jgi:Zn-dependent protease
MLRSLKIGNVYGVDVNVHPTFAIVPLWMIWQWGVSASHGLIAFILGILLVSLVFASVLLHELGHCAMAQQFGIRVLDITLWPFGGVARIEQMPSRPRAEFLIALAGPLTNLAITVALLPPVLLISVIAGRDALFASDDPLGTVTPATMMAYLALSNLFITLFNLLPAFPVDGGRMLRAVLSRSVGRDRATRIAVRAGLVFAIVFVVVGIWLRNPIPIILGLFVFFAAQAESRVERVQSAMRRLRVGQYALWDMGGVAPSEPLTFALRGGPRDIAVTENGRVVGMLWRSSLLEALAGGVPGRVVADVMDRSAPVADVNDSVFDVQQQMHRTNHWAVPVIEGGRYRGVFTADRFVSLYRQITPGMLGNRSISDEWREAIVHTLSFWKQYRRR